MQHSFIIEGNIGAGKSTFLRIMGNYLAAQCVFEPHQEWQNVGGENLLDHFYKDTRRWAYTFQSYAFITRVRAQERDKVLPGHPIQLSERSVYSDRYCFAKNCYEMGLMSSLEWKLYQEWFAWLVEGYTQKPAGFIYLRTKPEVCYQRLIQRNRSEEVAITLDYLRLLHDKHENWLVHKRDVAESLQNVPVLILDCDTDFEGDHQAQRAHVRRIIEFLEQQFNLPMALTKMPSVTL